MKKNFILISAIALVFTSCSSDDSPSEEVSSSVLVKKMILMSTDEGDDSYWNNTINFSYNGTKLTQSIDEDGYKSVYTYTGDLITKIEYFDGSTLDSQDLFSYNSNGKLIEYRDLDVSNDYERKFTYTYNSNGTVTVTEYTGTIGNTTVSLFTPNIYTFANGELTSTDNISIISYDSKNNPFKNVTGYQEIMTLEFTDDYMITFGRNQNFVSAPVGTSTTEGSFSTYTYNSDNYPVTSATTANYSGGFSGTVNVQYFYNN